MMPIIRMAPVRAVANLFAFMFLYCDLIGCLQWPADTFQQRTEETDNYLAVKLRDEPAVSYGVFTPLRMPYVVVKCGACSKTVSGSWIERTVKGDAGARNNTGLCGCWDSYPLGSRLNRRPGC